MISHRANIVENKSRLYRSINLRSLVILLFMIVAIPSAVWGQTRQELEKQRLQLQKEIKEINALYRAVAASIYNHTFWYGQNPNIFPERIKNFDYSIGPVNKLLKRHKADGLLVVYAADEISSSGRKALQVVKALNPFDQVDHGGVTSMVIGLTDRTGAILWFRTLANAGSYDLRDPKSSQAFVRDIFDDYPGGEK